MDIKIGRVATVERSRTREGNGNGVIEARLLATRRPRRQRRGRPQGAIERRGRKGDRDPLGARVLVLMVPDERLLPADLGSGHYRVLLRFVR